MAAGCEHDAASRPGGPLPAPAPPRCCSLAAAPRRHPGAHRRLPDLVRTSLAPTSNESSGCTTMTGSSSAARRFAASAAGKRGRQRRGTVSQTLRQAKQARPAWAEHRQHAPSCARARARLMRRVWNARATHSSTASMVQPTRMSVRKMAAGGGGGGGQGKGRVGAWVGPRGGRGGRARLPAAGAAAPAPWHCARDASTEPLLASALLALLPTLGAAATTAGAGPGAQEAGEGAAAMPRVSVAPLGRQACLGAPAGCWRGKVSGLALLEVARRVCGCAEG